MQLTNAFYGVRALRVWPLRREKSSAHGHACSQTPFTNDVAFEAKDAGTLLKWFEWSDINLVHVCMIPASIPINRRKRVFSHKSIPPSNTHTRAHSPPPSVFWGVEGRQLYLVPSCISFMVNMQDKRRRRKAEFWGGQPIIPWVSNSALNKKMVSMQMQTRSLSSGATLEQVHFPLQSDMSGSMVSEQSSTVNPQSNGETTNN